MTTENEAQIQPRMPSWIGAAEVLRQVQWCGLTDEWDPYDREACCPICRRRETEGRHRSTCALAIEAGLETIDLLEDPHGT